MVLMQQRIEQGALAGNCLSTGAFADDQRQQPLQGLIDRRLGRGQAGGRQSLVPHAVDRAIRRGGRSIQPRLLQLQQQAAGGHVFELAGPVAPVP